MTVRFSSRIAAFAVLVLTVSPATALPAWAATGRPSISRVAPATGPVNGGTHVRLVGTNFINVKSVRFGTTAAAVFAISGTHRSMTVTAPQSTGAKTVDITLRTASGTVTKSGAFTYTRSWNASWQPPQTVAPPVDSPRVVSCPSNHCYGMDLAGNFLDAGPGAGDWVNRGSPGGETSNQVRSSCPDFRHLCASLSCPQVGWCLSVDTQGRPLVWSNGTWQAYPSLNPPGGDTFDHTPILSCASTTFCMVMDGGAAWSTFNGTAWSPVRALDGTPIMSAQQIEDPAGPGNAPGAVSCAGDECLMARGVESYHFAAGSWAYAGEDLPTTRDGEVGGPEAHDLSCVNTATGGSTNLLCAVVGGAGNVYSGGTWGDSDKQATESVACRPDGRCLAVGGTVGYEFGDPSITTDPNGWSGAIPMTQPVPDNTAGGATAVGCAPAAACHVMLDHGFANTFTLQSHAWSRATSILARDDGISDVSCSITASSARYCLVGTNGPDIVGNDGSGWGTPQQTFDRDEQTASVSCVARTTFCMAVANNGRYLSKANHYAVYSHGVLTTHSMLTGTYRNLSCWSPTGCYVVSQKRVLRWNGSVWSVAVDLAKRHETVAGLSCTAGDQACLAVTPGDNSFWINGTRTSRKVYMNRKAGDVHPAGVACQSVHKCIAVTNSTQTAPGGDVFSDTRMDWLPQGGLSQYGGAYYNEFGRNTGSSVSCAPSATTTACLAITLGPAAEYDGAVHTVESPFQLSDGLYFEQLSGVTCPSTSACLVGDNDGRLHEFS